MYYIYMMTETDKTLSHIKLLLMDADGVLTDGSIAYTGDEMQTMTFNAKDGLGLRMIQKAGIIAGVVTGRKSDALSRRMRELGITLFFDGVSDKGRLLEQILRQSGCLAGETAFIGDDLADMSIMKKVGVPIAVVDAVPAILSCAVIVTEKPGGKGAVREICDAILQAKGLWTDAVARWE